MSNEYYPAICKSNVEVITDGIEEIKDNSIITKDGKETVIDAIIFATGFNAAEYPKELIVKGSNGIVLGELWKKRTGSLSWNSSTWVSEYVFNYWTKYGIGAQLNGVYD